MSLVLSLSKYPEFLSEIVAVCQMVHQAVLKKYPEHCLKAVGTILFLRFFNPAICTPQAFGIIEGTTKYQCLILIHLETPNEKAERGLVLISKIIQNLTNGTKFKEEYMEKTNALITKNEGTIRDFIRKIAVICQVNH
jgi:hypothetical protein